MKFVLLVLVCLDTFLYRIPILRVVASQARGERRCRGAGYALEGQGRQRADRLLPSVAGTCGTPGIFTEGLSNPWALRIIHLLPPLTMAQTLVFLVLIMNICTVSHSGEIPVVAPRLLPEVLTEVNGKKTLN